MKLTNSFRDLKVWRESMVLVEEIYTLSKRFPGVGLDSFEYR